MRTEVKIGIGVGILLATVVVGYFVVYGDRAKAPANNASDNRQAKVESNVPGIQYSNRSSNSGNPWATGNSSDNAANNAGNSVWAPTNNAANSSNFAWGNTTANNVASNNSSSNSSIFNAGNGVNNTPVNNAGNNPWANSPLWGNQSNNAANSTNSAWNSPANNAGNAVPPATGETRTYVVTASDTGGFWGIAGKPEVYGDSRLAKLLEEANKNIDPRSLRAGMTLKVPPAPRKDPVVPAGNPGVVTNGSTKTYTVAEGDTLWKIAERHLGSGTKASEILKANPGMTNAIRPGQKINLPDGATVQPGSSTPTSRPATTRPSPVRPAGSGSSNPRPDRPIFR